MPDQEKSSVWRDENNNASYKRPQQAPERGTAVDAYRILESHQKRVRRTSNRTTVSSYTGTTDKTDQKMFNAVTSVDRINQQKPSPTFGERSAQPTWHSTRNSGYPFSRNNQRREKLIIVAFAVVFIAIIVFLVVAVRGCSG